MIGVIFRHLFAEALRTWVIITAVLIFLTLGIGLTGYVADAAAGKIPVGTVATLTMLSIAKSLDIVLPVSMLLAVMLVVGRLCRDNEMVALLAGGAGLSVIYRPFLVLAALVAVFAGVMSIMVSPVTQQEINRLGAKTAANALQSVSPGRFSSFDDGRVSFYAQSRDKQGLLHDVFIRVLKDEQGQPSQIIVTAQTARQGVDDKGAATLVLENGWRYDGVPGRADYRIIHFKEHGIRIQPAKAANDHDVDAQSTLALMHSNDKEAIATWQTRVSVPLAIFILALIALPIGRVPPRSGRYGRIIIGILFFVIYLDLVRLSGHAIESGLLPAAIGEWWVHAVVLGIAIVLIARENGYFVRKRRRGRS